VRGVLVGLSGGVGSGKSTVARLLAAHGAVVIDADAIAREVVEPGTPGFDAVVARFGTDIVAHGRLDRAALARIVFGDEHARADLNSIVHPLVARRSDEIAAAAAPGAVVVFDVPLLVESGVTQRYDLVVIVLASEPVRLARLAARGMDAADARSRIAAQAGDEQRSAVADVLIRNDGPLTELADQVDALWTRLAGA
jgi:dephospho-CoA kinase